MRLVRWARSPLFCSASRCSPQISSFCPPGNRLRRRPRVRWARKSRPCVIAEEDGLRVAGEEALARELEARGIPAIATYRIVPKPELATADRAKPWFERAGIQGVVAVRPISKDKVREYSPATWTSSYYSSFWNYYGYGWGAYYSPGIDRTDTVVVVETLVFDMASNGLVWASVTETTNPKDTPGVHQ